MTVKELLRRVDSAELTEWMAWYRLNPCGDEVVCAQIALAIAVFVNANLKKGSSPAKLSDFYIVDRIKPRKKMTPSQVGAWAMGFVQSVGGVVKRGE